MDSTRKIGFGYSSDNQTYLSQRCLNVGESNISLTGGPQSVLTFNGVSSYSEVARQLDVDLSVHARIDLGVTSIDEGGSIHYTNYVKETSYSKSFIFNINAQLPSMRLLVSYYGDKALTEEARQLYRSDIKQFKATCGDQFILQESLGASLYISTKLEFATRTEINSFRIDSSWILGGVMSFLNLGSININQVLVDKRASLSVAVLQKGGDLSILNNTVPELSLQTNGVGILDCVKLGSDAEEGVKKCQGIMNRLLNYASVDFPQSIDDNNFELSSTLNAYRMNYTTIGIDPNAVAPTEEVKQIRKHLKSLYLDLTDKQDFVGKLLQETPNKYMNMSSIGVGWDIKSIPSTVLSQLYAINQTIYSSLDKIKGLDNTCYDNPPGCVDFNNNIDLSTLEIFEQSYIIKTKCNGLVYGPRYMLATDQYQYKEDSIFTIGNTTKNLVVNYKMIQGIGDNITITINQGCNYLLNVTRDNSYKFIDAYHATLSGDCANMVCPVAVSGIVEAEFILTDTPI